MLDPDRIERVAREAFGFAGLRPGQREAVFAERAEDALEFGYKTLALAVVRERALLRAA